MARGGPLTASPEKVHPCSLTQDTPKRTGTVAGAHTRRSTVDDAPDLTEDVLWSAVADAQRGGAWDGVGEFSTGCPTATTDQPQTFERHHTT